MAEYVFNKKGSLQRVVNGTILFSMLMILIISIIIVHIVVIIPTMGFYKREIRHEEEIVLQLLGEDYISQVFSMTKEIYFSTPEEIRADEFSEAYINRITPYIDQGYVQRRNLVSTFREKAEFENIAYVFYDDEMKRIVYVMDGKDAEAAYLPGQWVSDENGDIESKAVMEKAMNSNWFMPIAYGKAVGWVGTSYDGIFDKDGNLIGYFTVSVSINSLFDQLAFFLSIHIPIMLFFIIWSMTSTVRKIKKRVVNPIVDLTKTARKYRATDKQEEKSEPFFAGLSIHTGDEIEELWHTMVGMEEKVDDSITKIKEVTAAKEKIAAELGLAHNIQKGVLPTNFDSFSEKDNFELYASMKPARDVGGDFYDFFRIDERHFGLVIADVSDKGVPAALFMMTSKAIIRSNSIPGRKPSEILQITNNSLCSDNPNAMFLTVWLGIMDIKTGDIIAANAGHEYPFLSDSEGNIKLFEEPHGVVLGCIENMEYEDYVFTIPFGGMLFVYTDGVAEAQNEKEELFGTDRIEQSLNKYKDLSPQMLIESMERELEDYKGKMDQFDDITMLALKRKG